MKSQLVKFPNRDEFFGPLDNVFNNFFNDFFTQTNNLDKLNKSGYPKIDVLTDGNKFVIEAAIPGIDSKDIQIEILPGEDNQKLLKISGNTKEDKQYSKETNWLVKELKRSSFSRSLYLPHYIKTDPEAVFENGILKLTWITDFQKPERKLIPIKNCS